MNEFPAIEGFGIGARRERDGRGFSHIALRIYEGRVTGHE